MLQSINLFMGQTLVSSCLHHFRSRACDIRSVEAAVFSTALHHHPLPRSSHLSEMHTPADIPQQAAGWPLLAFFSFFFFFGSDNQPNLLFSHNRTLLQNVTRQNPAINKLVKGFGFAKTCLTSYSTPNTQPTQRCTTLNNFNSLLHYVLSILTAGYFLFKLLVALTAMAMTTT